MVKDKKLVVSHNDDNISPFFTKKSECKVLDFHLSKE
jgi:hypothetical protein